MNNNAATNTNKKKLYTLFFQIIALTTLISILEYLHSTRGMRASLTCWLTRFTQRKNAEQQNRSIA
jgi:hypothetical protein